MVHLFGRMLEMRDLWHETECRFLEWLSVLEVHFYSWSAKVHWILCCGVYLHADALTSRFCDNHICCSLLWSRKALVTSSSWVPGGRGEVACLYRNDTSKQANWPCINLHSWWSLCGCPWHQVLIYIIHVYHITQSKLSRSFQGFQKEKK